MVDPMVLLGNQQRAVEILVAAGQRYLEGLRDVASQSLLAQSALYQQAIANLFSFSHAGSPGDGSNETTRAITSAMEATVGSIRDAMASACKCNADMMTAFQDQFAAGAAGTKEAIPGCAHDVIREASTSRGRA
jgi:hypothetical protein